MKKLHHNSKLKGYRLHNARFRFTNQASIRTVKFPLDTNPKENTALSERAKRFGQSIKADYETLYGSFNFSTYYQKDHCDSYSLKRFWQDCLRAGGVIVPTKNELVKFLKHYTGENKEKAQDDQQKQLMRQANPDFYRAINFDVFKNEYIKKDTRSLEGAGKKDTIKNKLLKPENNFFGANVSEKQKEQLAEAFAAGITTAENYNEFLTQKYGVNKKIYPNPTRGLTFFLLPDLPLKKDLEPLACLQRIMDLMDKKGITSYSGKATVLIGISDKQNGLSNFFNEIFAYLCRGETEKVQSQMQKYNTSLWSGQQPELETRLKWLSAQAKKLGKPQLASSWHDYRTDFGGKIDSWITNSLSQDQEIYKELFGYEEKETGKNHAGHIDDLQAAKKELDTVDSNIVALSDNEKNQQLDSVKILTEIIAAMQNTLKQIKEKYHHTDKKDIDIDLLLDYRSLLSNFRGKFNLFFQKKHGLQDENSNADAESRNRKAKPQS